MGFRNHYLKSDVLTEVYQCPLSKKATVNLAISNTTGTSSFITIVRTAKAPLFVTERDHLWSKTIIISSDTPQEITGLVIGPGQRLFVKSDIDNIRTSVTSVESPADGHVSLENPADDLYSVNGLSIHKTAKVFEGFLPEQEGWNLVDNSLSFTNNNSSSELAIPVPYLTQFILEGSLSFLNSSSSSITIKSSIVDSNNFYSFVFSTIGVSIVQTIAGVNTTLGSYTYSSYPVSFKVSKQDNRLYLQLDDNLVLDVESSANFIGTFSLVGAGSSTTNIITISGLRWISIDANLPNLVRASTALGPDLQVTPNNTLRLLNGTGIIEEQVTNLISNNNLSDWPGTSPTGWSLYNDTSAVTKASSTVGAGNQATIVDNTLGQYKGALHQTVSSLVSAGTIVSLSFDSLVTSGNPMVRVEFNGGITTGSAWLQVSLTGPTYNITSSNLEVIGSTVDQLSVANWFRYKVLVRVLNSEPFMRLVCFGKTNISSTGEGKFANLQLALNQHMVEYQTTTKLADVLVVNNLEYIKPTQGSIWIRPVATLGQLSGTQTRKLYLFDSANLSIYREANNLVFKLGNSQVAYSYTDTLSQPLGFVWTSQFLRIYRGATIVAESLNPEIPLTIGNTLLLGSDLGQLYFLNGRLDTIQLSTKPLTQLDPGINTNHSFYWYFSTRANTRLAEYISDPIDMRFTTARVTSVDSITSEPTNTKIVHSYRWSQELSELSSLDFIVPSNLLSINGRYIQIKTTFTSSSLESPKLFHLSVNSINTPGLYNNLSSLAPSVVPLNISPFDTTGLQVEPNESLV